MWQLSAWRKYIANSFSKLHFFPPNMSPQTLLYFSPSCTSSTTSAWPPSSAPPKGHVSFSLMLHPYMSKFNFQNSNFQIIFKTPVFPNLIFKTLIFKFNFQIIFNILIVKTPISKNFSKLQFFLNLTFKTPIFK